MIDFPKRSIVETDNYPSLWYIAICRCIVETHCNASLQCVFTMRLYNALLTVETDNYPSLRYIAICRCIVETHCNASLQCVVNGRDG